MKDCIISIIHSSQELSFEQSFSFAQICMSKLYSDVNSDIEYGRRIVVNILDNWSKLHQSSRNMWENIIESAGFYPYIEQSKFTLNNLSGEIRKGLHASNNIEGKVFHDEQKEIVELLNAGKNVIVSAPTSFGKSLIIEEIIASRKYRSIVVIQPTLALLDETRKKLHKYNDSYKLIVRTNQEPALDKGNIFLFTAERVCEYSHFISADFLVIDEFYKLSGTRDDERSSSLNNAFYKMLRDFHPQFYLLGPNIDSISDGFAEAYGAIFYKSNYSLVDCNVINAYVSNEKVSEREDRLFDLLLSLSAEQTIIYCSSPGRVRDLSKKFYNYIISKDIDVENTALPLIEWIEKNISNKWSVINVLKYGIGIHDAALQKHITTSIIDYFNNGKINFLFCTSTIIEGVNTSAKNIIYYDAMKGKDIPIDYFDYSNIKGRAGRMMVHYTGNVYNFNTPPQKEDIIVDIPFFQQKPIKDEVLIQLDDRSVIDKNSQQYKDIVAISDDERNIIKKNGVSVKGQLNILNTLRTDHEQNYQLICWSGKPNYLQLEYILTLAWDNLLITGESTGVTIRQLVYLTFNYGCIGKTFMQLKDENVKHYIQEYKKKNKSDTITQEIVLQYEDRAIKQILQVVRHWFEYKVPKWLSVVNSLQQLVCDELHKKAGDYSYFANIIENDFLPEYLTLLSEYGIPNSAIKKIGRFVPTTINDDELLNYIQQNNLHKINSLISYEHEKICALFKN